MRMRSSGVISSLLVLIVATTAAAQPPREPGGGRPDGERPREEGPGGFRGPGGFGRGGGGFFNGGPFGGRPSAAQLVGMPEVQKELGLTEEQIKQIEPLQTAQREKSQAVFRDFDPRAMQDLAPEEREKQFDVNRKKVEEINQAVDADVNKLLKPEQQQRLAQLLLQREGAVVLTRDDIAKKLGLSEDQQSKLRDQRRQPPGGFGPPAENPQALTDALAVLDEKQKGIWKELSGVEFKFPAMRGFGMGGPGGPGGFGQPTRKIVKDFDKNGDGWLNNEERKAAREVAKSGGGDRGRRGPGGPGGPGGAAGQGDRRPDDRGAADRGPGDRRPEDRRPEDRGPDDRGADRRGPDFIAPGGPGGPGGGGGRFRGPGGPGGRSEPGKPGPKVSPADVSPVASGVPLYDPSVLRVVFLEFENADWETEMSDFHGTDVEVPATVTVDGKKYPNVGVHFRGMSSYGGVQAGSKRSLNLSFDLADEKQKLYGYKTLNLLNSHEDPTFLHTVLYSQIARQYIPTPKANFVKVVINGESWGVYVNVQQFDKIFGEENYDSKGARWKVRGSPGGNAGLAYVGDKPDDYKRRYEIKTEDNDKSWRAFIELCRVLNQTPPDQLEKALSPILDIEGALWFLALDDALINSDGYWVRASDYTILRDKKGKFHVVPHDMNETFQPAMGPGVGGFGGGPGGPGGGRRGGPGGGPGGDGGGRPGGPDARAEADGPRRADGPGGPERREGGPRGGNAASAYGLDPLVAMNDDGKPLRSKLLAVPALRRRYLEHVRTIAQDSLDWNKLGPAIAQHRSLIEKEIEADTRKLSSYDEFKSALGDSSDDDRGRGGRSNLRKFAEERRKFLLAYPAIVELDAVKAQ